MSNKATFVHEVGIEDADGTRRAVKRFTTHTIPTKIGPGLSLVLIPPGTTPFALPVGTMIWRVGGPTIFDEVDQKLEHELVEVREEPFDSAPANPSTG